jgi:hypothetical protein
MELLVTVFLAILTIVICVLIQKNHHLKFKFEKIKTKNKLEVPENKEIKCELPLSPNEILTIDEELQTIINEYITMINKSLRANAKSFNKTTITFSISDELSFRALEEITEIYGKVGWIVEKIKDFKGYDLSDIKSEKLKVSLSFLKKTVDFSVALSNATDSMEKEFKERLDNVKITHLKSG